MAATFELQALLLEQFLLILHTHVIQQILAEDHLDNHDAETEHIVGLCGRRITFPEGLGRGVGESVAWADGEVPLADESVDIGMKRFPKVNNLDAKLALDQDVGRLQVPMDDAALVQELYPIAHKTEQADLGEKRRKLSIGFEPVVETLLGVEVHHDEIVELS